ncbi:hypothetical protein [Hymenobacter negativus]|uniref:Uncharacterized protein n=1 Tax=Hymenobacter negativus TaxID=2795026 RepID=A0ABS3QF69_9BACT|nr:hypothetical protein [Hymenobacter negativus]MBO2009902.1 hypothetical protein [Hymenobacter negativus]
MPASAPLPTEGLPIRRLGVVNQATATIQRDDRKVHAGNKPGRLVIPLTFPAQIPLESSWQLQHASPTTGLLRTQNALVDLFSDPLHQNPLRLHTSFMRNIGLLDSIASVFNGLRADDEQADGRYGYRFPLLPPESMADGAPHLHYYRPLEAPQEQYLLLFDNCYASQEPPDEETSLVNLYALVQVEFDEERFIYLLHQAIDAACQTH